MAEESGGGEKQAKGYFGIRCEYRPSSGIQTHLDATFPRGRQKISKIAVRGEPVEP